MLPHSPRQQNSESVRARFPTWFGVPAASGFVCSRFRGSLLLRRREKRDLAALPASWRAPSRASGLSPQARRQSSRASGPQRRETTLRGSRASQRTRANLGSSKHVIVQGKDGKVRAACRARVRSLAREPATRCVGAPTLWKDHDQRRVGTSPWRSAPTCSGGPKVRLAVPSCGTEQGCAARRIGVPAPGGPGPLAR